MQATTDADEAKYLDLFLKTAATHRYDDSKNRFFKSLAETASIQAFRKAIATQTLSQEIKTFIDSSIEKNPYVPTSTPRPGSN